jgi:transposase InsO family protein
MNIIAYPPHELKTKYHACLSYASGFSTVAYICRRYHISKASLMRWMTIFDGTERSLVNKSHRPHTPHPHAHTESEIKKIQDLLRRNPHIGLVELFSKLRVSIGYSRHYASLYRFLKKLGFYGMQPETHKKYVPKPYETPHRIGEKAQLDVKYVPPDCNANLHDNNKYYQYTIIDEASRERFIYPYQERSSYSTVDFIQRAITFFGYIPKIIQTDNGSEFTYIKETNRIHPFDTLCFNLGITHKLIRPRTPRHNGKVERSHRNDQQRFYSYLRFYCYDDLKTQMKAYLKRSNNICSSALNWLTPSQKRQQLFLLNLVA